MFRKSPFLGVSSPSGIKDAEIHFLNGLVHDQLKLRMQLTS
jgi:hypothetical protein